MSTTTVSTSNPIAADDKHGSWQLDLKNAIRDPYELARRLQLPAQTDREIANDEAFPIFAPLPFVHRMEVGNPTDPLLRQVLPVARETELVDGFVADPVGDLSAASGPGLLQKYQGRALLVLSGACPVHCRYCFRRHFPYREIPRSVDEWSPVVDQIANDSTIKEVLLSGGDPLSHVDDFLTKLVARLELIPHLKRLRIHSRFPVMVPNRITRQLVDTLASSRLRAVFVIHANHGNEIDHDVQACLERLAEAKVLLLNQSVLLKGINDSIKSLVDLSERLLDAGVMPYYLSQLDRVQGSAHFEVNEASGLSLMEALRTRLPGYAVPKYVREVPGKPFKVPIC